MGHHVRKGAEEERNDDNGQKEKEKEKQWAQIKNYIYIYKDDETIEHRITVVLVPFSPFLFPLVFFYCLPYRDTMPNSLKKINEREN